MKLARVVTAAALIGCVPTAAHAVEWPTRKAGLWEMSIITDDGKTPAIVSQHCTDPAIDHEMNTGLSPISHRMCSRNDIEKTATGYVNILVCNLMGRPSITRAEITGDFNSAYSMKTAMLTENPPAGFPAELKATMNAKWLGACKADQKPGDVIMPGGVKINVKDIQRPDAKMK